MNNCIDDKMDVGMDVGRLLDRFLDTVHHKGAWPIIYMYTNYTIFLIFFVDFSTSSWHRFPSDF